MSKSQTVVRRLSALTPPLPPSPTPTASSASIGIPPRPNTPTPPCSTSTTTTSMVPPTAAAPPTPNTYYKISAGHFSPVPLRKSASMVLLNEAAEALAINTSNFERMKVNTTTQVFQINRTSAALSKSLLAVFKPATDEQDGFVVTSADKPEFFHGPEERALRERAAYVLDKAYNGFSKVPATALAQVDQSTGSLQVFIPNLGSVEDCPDLMLGAEAVQRVAALDLRIFNLDRHSGNVLVVKESDTEFGIIPIDHSLSLPPWYDLSGAWFDWAYLPCANEPLTANVREHVLALDYKKDAALLAELGIKAECIVTNTISTMCLQAMAQGNSATTLKDLSDMFQRPYPKGHLKHNDALSPLEELVKRAAAKTSPMQPAFPKTFAQILDQYVVASSKWRDFLV